MSSLLQSNLNCSSLGGGRVVIGDTTTTTTDAAAVVTIVATETIAVHVHDLAHDRPRATGDITAVIETTEDLGPEKGTGMTTEETGIETGIIETIEAGMAEITILERMPGTTEESQEATSAKGRAGETTAVMLGTEIANGSETVMTATEEEAFQLREPTDQPQDPHA